MKILIALLFPILVLACQHSEFEGTTTLNPTNEKTRLGKSDQKSKILNEKLGKVQLPLKEKERVPEKFVELDVMLVTHTMFAVVEYIDIEEEEFEEMTEITERYPVESSIVHAYKIEDQELIERYSHLKDRTIQLNNEDRSQYNASIMDFVIIYDMWQELPYVAAVLKAPTEDNWIYYAWTNSKGKRSYPFEVQMEFQADEEEGGPAHFTSLLEHEEFEEEWQDEDEVEYPETTVYEYVDAEKNHYQIIQYNVIGICGGLVHDLTAVYKMDGEKYRLLALDNMGYYFRDLIDTDGDGVPELLGADFTSTAIFSIEDGKLSLDQSVSWSSNECPC